jgi:putative IMPACT (imprinted ancient) family translation regulator
MSHQSARFDFENSKTPQSAFSLHEYIIEDRGSKYSVSYGAVSGREDIKVFLKQLKSNKKYATADHNSWAARISKDGILYETKSDDGETGAGMVILRVMQKEEIQNCVICVTRWFGGTYLMTDRFKHLQDATKLAISHIKSE